MSDNLRWTKSPTVIWRRRVFFCVAIILLLMTVVIGAGVAEANTLNANMFDTTSTLYEAISFTDWTSSSSMPDVAGNYTLMNDVLISSTWIVHTGETNLDLNGHSITFIGNSGRVISIYSSGTTLNLYDRVGIGKITGGKGVGGAIYICDGKFIMYGGNISGNTAKHDGGGIYVCYDGNFTMYGGNISGNTAERDGGGVYVWGGKFTQYGGNITGNTASKYGGGVYVWYNNFTQCGGNISGNTAEYGGGVYVWHGDFTQCGGNITDNTAECGGGVSVGWKGTFTLSGGNITDNTAEYGDGIYVSDGNFIKYGGNIAGNTVYSVGCVSSDFSALAATTLTPTVTPTNAQSTKPTETPAPIVGLILGGLVVAVLRRK